MKERRDAYSPSGERNGGGTEIAMESPSVARSLPDDFWLVPVC